MIHDSAQLHQDFPYLSGENRGNFVQNPSEKSITRFVGCVIIAFLNGAWVRRITRVFPNESQVIPMEDSWSPAACGHFDPMFVVRGFKIDGWLETDKENGDVTHTQVCFDARFPFGDKGQGDNIPRFITDSYAEGIIHPGEITRLWLDTARTATKVDSITLYM